MTAGVVEARLTRDCRRSLDMLTRETGRLAFSEPQIFFSPALTKAGFEAMALFKDARLVVNAEPILGWQIGGSLVVGQASFVARILFDGERIETVYLCSDESWAARSPSDWPPDPDGVRDHAHEEWLRENVGAERAFAWGAIRTIHRREEGWSAISVEYGPRGAS